MFTSVSYEALFFKSVASSSGVSFLNEIFMCLTCIEQASVEINVFFCINSYKNV
jgi:hypothetical protein